MRYPRRGLTVAATLTAFAVIGCSPVTESSAPQTTSAAVTYYETDAGKKEMVATAKGVIAAQASQKSFVVTTYGPAAFPTPLEVVMWGDVSDPGKPPSRLWFKVAFAGAADSVHPLGPAKVALSESGPWQ
ncbi:hypothetical protein NDR87_31045 [Nocardia sp. CDC159]|uniref:Lipoprotein n=1 Tax=Nocardia pulmonis TaxID=2951408 RepID=A0A9X2IZF2_9NOCA|nr:MULTISPECIES: hypothetical protein [Nocardia]MCM6778012.1 hypothetical protein [Nocardia pulmonis]MCM6790817.1 hypothetical protein [Nocardia sp. CDC159]